MPESMAKSKLCKALEGTVCLFCVPILLPAIYGCTEKVEVTSTSPKGISMSGACWGLLSYGALAEWVMSVSWLFYMLSTGWDLVHVWEWNRILATVPSNWQKRTE
jgi:energy-converting hydrogenase Eha subunit G